MNAEGIRDVYDVRPKFILLFAGNLEPNCPFSVFSVIILSRQANDSLKDRLSFFKDAFLSYSQSRLRNLEKYDKYD